MKSSHSTSAIWLRRLRLPMRAMALLLLLTLAGPSVLQPLVAHAEDASTLTVCYNHDKPDGFSCLAQPTDSGQLSIQDQVTFDVYVCVLEDGASGNCTVGTMTASVGLGGVYTCLVNGVLSWSCHLLFTPSSEAPHQCLDTNNPPGPLSCQLFAADEFHDTHRQTISYNQIEYACLIDGETDSSCTIAIVIITDEIIAVGCLVSGQLNTSCNLVGDFIPTACNVGSGLGPNDPADLLNLSQFASVAQCKGIEDLERQAVQKTIEDHGLESTDTLAAQTWARSDALAELWGLFDQALKLPACTEGQIGDGVTCRTASQQAAVDWMVSRVKETTIRQVYRAGLEYSKWAGLNLDTYKRDWDVLVLGASYGIDTTAYKSTLEGFLNQAPTNYAFPEPGVTWTATTPLETIQATATEGYCVYQPPAPYQTDYSPDGPLCNLPGGGIICSFDCTPTYPPAEQFLKWGTAGAQGSAEDAARVINAERAIAASLTLGGIAASAPAGIGTYNLLLPVFTSVFESVMTTSEVTTAAATTVRTFADTAAPIVEAIDGLEIADSAAAATTTFAGIASGIIFFVTTLTAEVLKISNNAALAGQIASSLEIAASATPTINLSDSNTIGTLFMLFTKATLPAPAINCSGLGCLNPPPPPAAGIGDFVFGIKKNGGAPVFASSITLYDQTTQVTTNARLHTSWFIKQQTDSAGNLLHVTDNDGVSRTDTQSLKIVYTDWAQQEEVAILAPTTDGNYEFVSMLIGQGGQESTAVDPSTCKDDGTCSVSASLQYIDSSGNQYEATVLPPPPLQAPSVNPTWSSNPTEGQPVTIEANATAMSGAAITSYSWEIEDKPLNADPTTVTKTDDPLIYTFPTSGVFSITLTVTDTLGQQTVHPFMIEVESVAPKLTLYAGCAALKPDFCIRDPISSPYGEINLTLGLPGGTTTLGGWILSPGSEDAYTLDINWGDDTPHDVASNTGTTNPNIVFPGTSPGELEPGPTFSASHAYVNGGEYGVEVKLTNQDGTVVKATILEVILIPTSTTLIVSENPATVGQEVAYKALISPNPDGGIVSFKDQDTDTTLCSAVPVTTGATNGVADCRVTYPDAGQRHVVAIYSGDSRHSGSTSAAIDQSVLTSTTTSLQSSNNPSTAGQQVVYSALISPKPDGGTVEFRDQGTGATLCSATQVSSDGTNGVATCAVSYSTPGTHTIVAVFSGDETHAGSTSSSLTQTVNKAGTEVTLSSSTTSSVWGEPVTFTATISATSAGAGVPSGTVEFKDGDNDIVVCANVPLDTTTGTAACTIATLSVGDHSITAVYSGDDIFLPSDNSASPMTQTVGRAGTTSILTSSNSPVMYGESVTFTVHVVANAPGAGTPSGSITFEDGATTLGNVPLDDTGRASLSSSSLAVGAHTITASYDGDENFTGSDSSAVTQQVDTDLSAYPKTSSGAYDLSGANLSGAYLVDMPLADAKLNGSKLTGVVLRGSDLSGASLIGSNLKDADLSETNLTDANLSASNLSGANFTNADLSGAILMDDNLKGANFSGANLSGSQLIGSNLEGANFTGANLTNASVLATNLMGANFTNANLTGASFVGSITRDAIWSNTTCSNGSNSDANQGTCSGHL